MIVLVILAFILLNAILEYLVKKGKVRRPGLVGGIIGALGGGVMAQIIHSHWSLPGWTSFPVGFGFAALTGGVGIWLGRRVLPRTVGNTGQPTKANHKDT